MSSPLDQFGRFARPGQQVLSILATGLAALVLAWIALSGRATEPPMVSPA